MANFEKPVRPTPTTLGNLRIVLDDKLASTDSLGNVIPAKLESIITIDVLDADGKVMKTVHTDLMDKLTTNQQTGITNLITAIRTKAGAEILS